jgi:hypothetical protein
MFQKTRADFGITFDNQICNQERIKSYSLRFIVVDLVQLCTKSPTINMKRRELALTNPRHVTSFVENNEQEVVSV